MKILSVTWTIYDDRLKEFMNNCTGGGLVIKNLCEHLGRKAESYLLIGKVILPEIQLGNIRIIKSDYDKSQVNEKGNNQDYLEYMADVFEAAVEEIKPDIVNFHGYGEFAFRCIKKLQKVKKPRYVVTDHLFISRDDCFSGYESTIVDEDYLYHIPNVQIIAVSNGMKNKIRKDFPHVKENQVQVILNGTDFEPIQIENDFCEKYNLQDKKILLCVGTILERKNQLQIVHAFMKDKKIKEKVAVIFCGNDSLHGKLQNEISANNLENILIYAGAINSNDMKKFYSMADGLIMPSYAEGLSIAALETIAYGKPVIMYEDSECAIDLCDPKVVCFANARTDKALADAIWRWYDNKWDAEYIKKYAKWFTMERMADDYLNYYRQVLQ